MTQIVGFLLGLLPCLFVPVDHTLAQDHQFTREQVTLLEVELARKNKEFRQAIAASQDPAEQKRITTAAIQFRDEFPRRLLALAQADPQSPAVPSAFRAIIVTSGQTPEVAAAIEQLRRDWLLKPEIAVVCTQLTGSPNPQVEPLLRDILAQNSDRTARGVACSALAGQLAMKAQVAGGAGQDPQNDARSEARYGHEYYEQIKRMEPEPLLKEAEELYERVIREFADVRLYPEFAEVEATIGTSAQKWLDRQHEFGVGKPAAEIVGKDVDGQPIKLSDYRGKVVVINFWASWCAPCMAAVPHERKLVQRLEGKPFVLLGVNCDRTAAAARDSMSKERMTWPNVFDGPQKPGGVADLYHIQGIPAVLVLDRQGIIRFKNAKGHALDEAVDHLLAETTN